MVKHLSPALALSLLLVSIPSLVQPQIASTDGDLGAARVIVKLKPESPLLIDQTGSAAEKSMRRTLGLAQRLGLAMSAGRAISERIQVVQSTGVTSATLAQRLSLEDDVEYAVPDERRRIVTAANDPLYATGAPGTGPAVGQWYLRAPSGAVQSSIDIETAWNITQGNPAIVVAVVDTGVRYDHPDLLDVASGGKLLPGYTMISDLTVANDGDGRDTDASDPGDWVTAAEASKVGGPFYRCTAESSSWHGTQVSGLIAALTNNALGMAGVGPALRVLPVRVLGKCGGFDSDIIAGMRWAAGLSVPGTPPNPTPARVINLSLGSPGACTAAYADAISQITGSGTVIVASAGNSEGGAVEAPANCSGVIAVAGLRHVGTKVGFSSVGSEVAISAPAGNCVNTAAGTPCLYPILTSSNSGTTSPVAPIYTDSYNTSLGTSFSSPLVAATAALVLSVQPTLTPQQVRVLLQGTARQFPTTSDSAGIAQCALPQSDGLGNAVVQDECICNIDTCGAGMLNAGAAVTAAAAGTAAASVQAQGLWWNAPAGSESGWGINFADQGDSVFATWFTYDPTGRAWWLSMTATKTGTSPDSFSGPVIASRGPPFSSIAFDPNSVVRTPVGSGTLTFNDLNRGTFSYVVNGIQQTKTISRQAFGPVPMCSYGPQPNLVGATNYQDLWWVAAESGWGINLTQQGNSIFATWFTYDADGAPLWLSMSAPKTAPNVYSGALIKTAGPAFSSTPFNSSLVTRTVVGNASLTFSNGNAATFAYTVNGVSQAKQITRQLSTPMAGTLCQ